MKDRRRLLLKIRSRVWIRRHGRRACGPRRLEVAAAAPGAPSQVASLEAHLGRR